VFDGVTFEHTAADFSACFPGAGSQPSPSVCEAQSAADQRTAAVHLTDSVNMQMVNVTVRHTGGYGVWLDKGCRDSALLASHVSDVGAGAVRVGGSYGGAAPFALEASNVTVADSVLEDGGHVWRMGCGVLLQAANTSTVEHNLIRQFLYTGAGGLRPLTACCSDCKPWHAIF
jgi:hypothetical protein